MGTIGERIRQLRKAKLLTQPVLARAVGIDQSTLSDIERGAGFNAETLMRLAEELGVSCEFIMRGRVASEPSQNLRRAKQVISALNEEERLDLLTAIMQPGLPDHVVEERIPATKRQPSAKDLRLMEESLIPKRQRKVPLKKSA